MALEGKKNTTSTNNDSDAKVKIIAPTNKPAREIVGPCVIPTRFGGLIGLLYLLLRERMLCLVRTECGHLLANYHFMVNVNQWSVLVWG